MLFFNSKQIGVLAIHLHQLIIDKSFYSNHQEISIETFRICISAYGLSRYSKSVRVYSTDKQDNLVRFNQTIHMIIRVKERNYFL